MSWGGTKRATLVGTGFRFNSQNTYNGGTGTSLTQTSGLFQLNVSTVGTPGSITSGPFGQGTVIPNNSASPPILEAYGADRTLANSFSLTSGFVVDSASSYSGIFNDASGAHNLSLTGNMSVSGSKGLTNNMVSGVALYLGGGPSGVTVANPASTITIASGGNLTLLQQVGGSPLLSYLITPGNGNTVINDAISGAGGLTVQNGAFVTLNT